MTTGARPGGFWDSLRKLVDESRLAIDRPKGTRHPRYPEVVYPLDYGYLDGTTAADGDGIDVWIGSQSERAISGVVCTIDLQKRDAELKILLGCTEEEVRTILNFQNEGSMRAVWIGCPEEQR